MTDQSLKTEYHVAAMGVADLVADKQKAYGNSFGKAGAIIKILYPGGVPAEKLDDMLTIIRMLDKMFRIATCKDAFDESPYADIAGYALLAMVRDEG